MKTGVQGIYKFLKILDSGFRRNDWKPQFQIFYEIIKDGKADLMIHIMLSP
jgi:hypothetical protein